ncbi:MAG TPA: hypothetical protein PKW79_06465 [Rhabdochlamydiaceae bacterium]|nr:hypothetical protein [Rhabdochlamydiaceae bacterium]
MKFVITILASIASMSFLMANLVQGENTSILVNEKDRSGKLVKCADCGGYYNQGNYHNCSKK